MLTTTKHPVAQKTAILLATLTLLLIGAPAQAAHAASSPVPGRFCKSIDVGKKVNTARYGVVKCKRVGGYNRWVRL